MKRRQAFTLIELLVAIGIIAVLISMLLPAMRRVRQAAKSAQCSSNMRQVYFALSLYAGAHQGVMPQGVSQGRNPAGTYVTHYWHDFLRDNPQASHAFGVATKLRCPQNDTKTGTNYAVMYSTTTVPSAGFFIRQYALGRYAANPGDSYVFRGIRAGRTKNSSNFVLLIDSAQQDTHLTDYKLFNIVEPRPGTAVGLNGLYNAGGQWHQVWMAHPNAANAVFADGHVERCDATRLASVANSPNGITKYWDSKGVRP